MGWNYITAGNICQGGQQLSIKSRQQFCFIFISNYIELCFYECLGMGYIQVNMSPETSHRIFNHFPFTITSNHIVAPLYHFKPYWTPRQSPDCLHYSI